MSDEVVALIREQTGKGANKRLRRDGRIPAVLYGDGQPTTLLSMDARAFMRVLGHRGRNQLLQLKIEDGEHAQTLSVMMREVQQDPLGERPLHVDFVAVNLDQEVHVRVPLHIIGEHKRIKDGSVIEQLIHELDITCLPSQIPERIEVDVSGLEVGDTVYVRDLQVPEGIKKRSRPDESVATTVMPVKVADLADLTPEPTEVPVTAG